MYKRFSDFALQTFATSFNLTSERRMCPLNEKVSEPLAGFQQDRRHNS